LAARAGRERGNEGQQCDQRINRKETKFTRNNETLGITWILTDIAAEQTWSSAERRVATTNIVLALGVCISHRFDRNEQRRVYLGTLNNFNDELHLGNICIWAAKLQGEDFSQDDMSFGSFTKMVFFLALWAVVADIAASAAKIFMDKMKGVAADITNN
jgi:hypothetical protein